LDYLINGLSTTALIVAQYTTNGNAANIKVLDRCYCPLKTNADSVVTDWNSEIVILQIMELVGSSVNSTTNNFVKNLEKIFVLANLNSAGLFSGGIKYPEKVEVL
jgi:hypothetical protein